MKRLTKRDRAQLEQELKAHNREMKQIRCHDMVMNLEQYIDYKFGKKKHNSKKVDDRQDHTPNYNCRNNRDIPSHGPTVGDTNKKEIPQYTGDNVIGIAQTHKSNAVPVTNKQQAIDVANMRRN